MHRMHGSTITQASFSKQRELNVYSIISRARYLFEGALPEQLTILAVALNTPTVHLVSKSCISFFFGPLASPLMEGALPNLERLYISNIGGLALQQLGDIYRAGGLVKLEELSFWTPTLAGSCMRAWMDGVLASEHRGVALERLEFYIRGGTSEDCAASQVLLEVLSAGAYSNLQDLHATAVEVGERLEFMGGELSWHPLCPDATQFVGRRYSERGAIGNAANRSAGCGDKALETLFPQLKYSRR